MSHATPGPAASTPGRARTPSEAEVGQIGVLILGMCVLVLTVVVGIVNVTAVQRARVRLYDACDAAALDAADALSEATAYRSGLRANVPVTQDGVRAEVDRYLAATPRPPGVRTWRWEPGTGTRDGRSATVVLTGVVEVPIADGLLATSFGPVAITVTATAEGHVDPIRLTAP